MHKLFEINSIRNRMVTGFLFLTFLILILAIASLTIIDRITKIAQVHSNISQLEIYSLSLIKYDNDFLDLETINENYFKTHESGFLQIRDSLNSLISINITGLLEEERNKNYGIGKNIIAIDSTLSFYNTKFKILEELVFKKGFKDYGVEGAMRLHAHMLEDAISDSNISNLLQLRRHEKDFLLRNDTIYLRAFKNRADLFLAEMKRDPYKNKEVIYHLLEYQKFFFELAKIQFQLGLSSKHGLRSELNNLTYSLSDQYYSLSEYSYIHSEAAFYNVRTLYITLLSGAILFSIISGYWISKRLSEPIARLSKLIHEAISAGNVIKTDFSLRNAAIEINTLASSFILLMNQIKIQMNKVKIKSKLLREKNLQLKKLNRELDNFLYSTAHDLRSPLSSLRGLINLIRYENKQNELNIYFDKMEKSIHHSETFISQIVSFSQNKKMEIIQEKIDLGKLVADIFENHQFIDGSSKIEKAVTINSAIAFFSDRNRMTILFNNLISNAIKYADLEKEKPCIKIVIHINEQEVDIEFMDNGLGIGEEHVENIFEMFYRAHTDSIGSGLGLFIFKETLNRLNGKVTVESFVGIGSKFHIRLPNLTHEIVATKLSTNV